MIIDPRYPKVNDDVIFRLGTDSDIALVLRSTALATNTALTDVLVGTPVTPAIAANSLILSNITAGGDVLMAGNRNGNSEAFLWYDTSTGDLSLYSRGTGSFDIYDDATKILDFTSGVFTFQQLTDISTAVGALRFAAAAGSGITFNPSNIDNDIGFNGDSIGSILGTNAGADAGFIGMAGPGTGNTLGFAHMPSMVGVATGTPSLLTGRSPFHYDTTNNRFRVYNSAWVSVALAGIGIQGRVPYRIEDGYLCHPNQLSRATVEQPGGEDMPAVMREMGFMDERICFQCGEMLTVGMGRGVALWPNKAEGSYDLHAVFGHIHPEREPYIQGLAARILALEARLIV